MKKLLFFIGLLAISNTLSFGQSINVMPFTNQSVRADEGENLEQYFNKNVVSNTKVTLLNEGFEGATFPPTGWTKQNLTTNPALQWMTSTVVHSGAKSAQVNSELTGIIRDEWLISPSVNLTTLVHPSLKFWWDMSYYWSISPNDNYDFRVKVSPDGGITWNTVWSEDSIGETFSSWVYSIKLINLANYATSTNFKVAFQYVGKPGTILTTAALYIDDVIIEDMPLNNLTVTRVTLHDAYTKIPKGLGLPVYYDADFMNLGYYTQTNIKLHGVDLSTGTEETSIDTTLLPEKIVKKRQLTDYFFTPPSILGNYKVTSYLSSDSIAYLAQDTFNISVVCDTCLYSRDNNTYVSSRWAGATTGGTTSVEYTAANRLEVNDSTRAMGVNCVVNINTKVGSKIKGVLYQLLSATGTRVIVAQSANYYISAADIPTSAPMVNPPSINLNFANGFTLKTDSLYFIGVQSFGGTDTVRIATDNTGIPQWDQSSQYFVPADMTWYIWGSGNVPAMMIRTIVRPLTGVGINEITNPSATLFTCMPNPATTSTQISYELKNNENTTIFINDIMGRTVKTLHQGMQSKGNYALNIDVSDLSSGTYFYTLKTNSTQATEKLIIVNR